MTDPPPSSSPPPSTIPETMPLFPNRPIHFSTFLVTPQVFHLTPLTFGVVNLKPLLPGHVLLCPLRPLPRLADLTRDELTDLFASVQKVQRTLKRLYKAEAFNVAIQDGEAAGQSVPHVHCHVIPRRRKDGGEGDKVHEWLEGEEGDVGGHMRGREKGEWVKDEERKARSTEEMEREARRLREEIEKDEKEDDGKL